MAEPSDRADSLQKLLWLINDIDQLVELAMAQHAPISETIPRAIDRLLKYVDASAVTVRVPDDSGELHDFVRPADVSVMRDQVDELTERLKDVSSVWYEREGGMIYGQRLDLSISFLGAAIVHFDDRHEEWERDLTQRALYHWAEIVDNYVAAMADARVKQEALAKISDAFKAPILENALDGAIEEFSRYVDFESLVVVCQSEEVMQRSSYTYRIVSNGESEYSSAASADPRVQALVEDAVTRILANETVDGVLDELQIDAPFLEDVPIFDLSGERIVGRVILGMSERINPLVADLIDRFSDYLRQRVVDFSREWRNLSRVFPTRTVERLLREPNYRERFLSAREADVALLYTDIAGFTRLSEQVLDSPTAVGNLIDRWSRHVVEIIWETGGVFDKMVGDCIIGIWGPPFYEDSPQDICRNVIDAARRIRDYTAALASDIDFPELTDSEFPIGVATGVNYSPICVGIFGPNDDFTGFSSGMNNAARLQGVASIHEILCMDSFVKEAQLPDAFGEQLSAEVKNVAEPLKYHQLVK